MNNGHLYGVQIMNSAKAATIASSDKPLSFDERMALECKSRGVTSLLYQPPSGNVWLFVGKDEKEVITVFMKAAIDTLIARGMETGDGPITLRKVTGFIAPGCDYYWQVNGVNGTLIASGYAKDEAEAAKEISKNILTR